jgi:hypothetical protein
MDTLIWFRIGATGRAFVNSSEPLGFINCWEFLKWLLNWQLLMVIVSHVNISTKLFHTATQHRLNSWINQIQIPLLYPASFFSTSTTLLGNLWHNLTALLIKNFPMVLNTEVQVSAYIVTLNWQHFIPISSHTFCWANLRKSETETLVMITQAFREERASHTWVYEWRTRLRAGQKKRRDNFHLVHIILTIKGQ